MTSRPAPRKDPPLPVVPPPVMPGGYAADDRDEGPRPYPPADHPGNPAVAPPVYDDRLEPGQLARREAAPDGE